VEALAELAAEAAQCRACRLAEGRTTVVFAAGNPEAPLMLVGEAPGRDEDLAGEPFVGRSGQLLDRLLAEELGVGRDGCYIANVVKCRPPNNRDPRPDEVAACRRFLSAQIALVAPRVVVSLGNVATRELLGTSEGVTRVRGRTHRLGDATLVPTFHPSAALRSGGVIVAQMRADLVRAKRALASAGVPGT
jgi:uracil-DNA glycosylase family 4